MNTPICDFVDRYKDASFARLHMPGHKGNGPLGVESRDITEISGADVLYSADGIIEESQNNAARLFNTAKTLYSCEGSSLCIRAMLYLAVLEDTGHVRHRVLAARNAHKSFFSACALLDLDISYIGSGEYGCPVVSNVTPNDVRRSICEEEDNIACVYITSPDYLGNISDIKGISEVCREFGVTLIVDNAHGAYLNFLDTSMHPISLGADMCCDSAHKTLPVLTGGAYLHLSSRVSERVMRNSERAMSLFASTSPSYLILQSLDAANLYMSDGYRDRLRTCAENVGKIKKQLMDAGFELTGDEGLKITVAAKSYGYTGYELAKYLWDNGISCEFADPDLTVMMITPNVAQDELLRLVKVMTALPRRASIESCPPHMTLPRVAMSVREAVMSDFETLPLCDCRGRVLAQECVSCPPAVPVVACGEIIDDDAIDVFRYYGIEKLKVVR